MSSLRELRLNLRNRIRTLIQYYLEEILEVVRESPQFYLFRGLVYFFISVLSNVLVGEELPRLL